jgi:cell division protein FtsI/penicillin-binding protein 2
MPPRKPRSAAVPAKIFGRPRSTVIKAASLASAALVAIIAGITGIGPSDPSVTVSVKNFLLAWESGNYATAAAMTTGNQVAVAHMLKDAYSQIGAADLTLGMGPISVRGDTAVAHFDAAIDLGRGGRPWKYRGNLNLRKGSSGWLIVWSPSVIVPGLGAGDRLAVLTQVPVRAPLLDAAGEPLIPLSPAVEVGVRPGRDRDPAATAAKLAKVIGLPPSDADQMVGQIRAALPNRFLELVRLAPLKFRRLSAALGKVPHLTHRWVTRRLFRSAVPVVTGQVGTEAAKELVEDGAPYRPGTTVGLSGLEESYQATLAGTPTTEVVVQNAAGVQVRVLKRWQGKAGSPVRTTIKLGVQQAAQRALAGLGFSASVVAVRASTGQILAVAERQAGGMPGVDPLAGQYQPGQSFTIVPTAALLAKERWLSIDHAVPCSHRTQVGQQFYVNIPPVPRLGKPRFGQDFAHACSTAFATLSVLLKPDEFYAAAGQFGIGVPWRLPLRPTPFVGSIRKPSAQGEQAADAIGTGTVLVSPLNMALAAGVVESGSWHRPSIVTNPSGPTLTARVKLKGLKGQVANELRQLMASTVSSGAASAAHLPGTALYGQVGTAPLAGHHGMQAIWFVGFRGGVAFSVLAFSRSTAFDPAVQIARIFAESLPAGA